MELDVGTAMAAKAVNIHLITVNNLSLAYTLIKSMMYNGTEYRVEVMFHKGNFMKKPFLYEVYADSSFSSHLSPFIHDSIHLLISK